MKKVLFTLAAILGLGFVLVATSCGGGGGGDGDELVGDSVLSSYGVVRVQGGTVTGGDKFSLVVQTDGDYNGVFITGRSVSISSFYICDHEVTQGEYEKYCSYKYSPSAWLGLGKNFPVYNVSWYEVLVYCNRRSIAEGLTPCYTIRGKTNPDEWGSIPSYNATLDASVWNAVECNFIANGYRLPTELEWEYAARGGEYGCSVANPTDYAGTDDRLILGNYAWYIQNSGDKVHEVKKKSPNALGLYDMSGNVSEFCWDWQGTVTCNTSVTGPAEPMSISNPTRTRRGGYYSLSAQCCSIPFRMGIDPSNHYSYVGFRVVRSAE